MWKKNSKLHHKVMNAETCLLISIVTLLLHQHTNIVFLKHFKIVMLKYFLLYIDLEVGI